jgi:uncharacterized protein (TIGR04255 family)
MDISMATPRDLRNPPIVEALVDIRAAVSASPETFEAVARELQSTYPTRKVRRGVKAEFRVEQGKLIPPTAEDLGFQGVMLHSESGRELVQFRPDGFTFNNLKSYLGGDALLAEALRLWSVFSDRLHPTAVTRVALRYINQLSLPYRQGDDFAKYLTAAPSTPEGAPQIVNEFLSRVVAYDSEASATIITTQRLTTPDPSGFPLVVIDVDAFCVGEFPTDAQALRATLNGLRTLKNRTFFSLLTDAAVELFI